MAHKRTHASTHSLRTRVNKSGAWVEVVKRRKRRRRRRRRRRQVMKKKRLLDCFSDQVLMPGRLRCGTLPNKQGESAVSDE